ncbi:MAG: hypothetical protein V4625_12780 [Pseudomonadota bacterium]
MTNTKRQVSTAAVFATAALAFIPVIGIYAVMLRALDLAFKSRTSGRIVGIHAILLAIWLGGAWMVINIGFMGMYRFAMSLGRSPFAHAVPWIPYMVYFLACLAVGYGHTKSATFNSYLNVPRQT